MEIYHRREARKIERERRELRYKVERSSPIRHLKEQLTAEDNQLLDSRKRMDVDPGMRGMIAKDVSDRLKDLEKRYGIEENDFAVLQQLALLYRFYPSFFLEKCNYIEQCFRAGIDPFELIDLGELHMEFAMSFLYEIRAMRKGVALARKRKAESLKTRDDGRFAKVHFQYIEKKDTLENLLKNEFQDRIIKGKEAASYNSLKSAYYRAIKRTGLNRELSLEDFLYFFWDKTALLFSYGLDGELKRQPWRVTLTSSATRSKLGVVRDYILGINAKKITFHYRRMKCTPYDEMWDGLAQ